MKQITSLFFSTVTSYSWNLHPFSGLTVQVCNECCFQWEKAGGGGKGEQKSNKMLFKFYSIYLFNFCHFPKYVGDDFFCYITKILAMANTSKKS